MALTEMRVNLCQNGSFTKDTFWWWSWKSEIAAENGRLRIKAQDANGFNKVAISQRVNLGGPAATDQRWASVAADFDTSPMGASLQDAAMLALRFYLPGKQTVHYAVMIGQTAPTGRGRLIMEVPPGAESFDVYVGVTNLGNRVGTIYADNVLIQLGPTRESVANTDYFDGDTPTREDGRSGIGWQHQWTGDKYRSASRAIRSVLPGKEIAIEAISAGEGHPAVSLAVHGDGTGYSVTRTVRGFTTLIRGGADIRISSLDYLEDHEIPLGETVTYTLRHEVTEQSWSASVRLDSPSAWLSDPLDWTSAIELDMGDQGREDIPLLTAGSLSGHKWGVGGKTVLPLGARLPVQLGAARTAPEGLKAIITTWDQRQADRVAALVEQAGVLLLRVPHDPQRATLWGGYLPADVGVEWVAEGITQWDLSGGVIAPPALPVLVVRATYDRSKELAAGATYDAIKSRLGTKTYADIKRRPLQIGG